MELKDYNPKSELNDYYTVNNNNNHLFKNILQYINKIKVNNTNFIDVDTYFYSKVNDLNFTNKNETLKHIYNNGVVNGLIYHPKQLFNIFPKIRILEQNNDIYIKYNEKIEKANEFIKRELYDKDFDFYITQLQMKKNKLLDEELLLIVFIGNLEVGNILLDKIIKYKTIEKFAIGICFRNNDIYKNLKSKIKQNFNNYATFISKEYGNDITPSLMMYHSISNLIKFSNIIKLQTKTSNKKWFNEMTDFLLNKHIVELQKFKKNSCNCIGSPKVLSHVSAIYSPKTIDLFKNYIDKTTFVAGTAFYCERIVIDKTIELIKTNYKMFFNNNLYDTGYINLAYSPPHFLERLFGVIKIQSTQISQFTKPTFINTNSTNINSINKNSINKNSINKNSINTNSINTNSINTNLTKLAIVSYKNSNDFKMISEKFDVYIITTDIPNDFSPSTIKFIKNNDNYIDNDFMASLFYKTHLNELIELKQYEFILWLDFDIIISIDKITLLSSSINTKTNFLTLQNNKNILQIYNDNIKYEFVPQNILIQQIKKQYYTNLSLQINNCSDLFIYNNKLNNNFLNNWWYEIKNGYIVDVLTFNYIIKTQKNKINVKTIKDDELLEEINLIKTKFNNKTDLNDKINFVNDILWINLNRSIHRKLHMETLLKDLSNKRISAIDALTFDFKNNIINASLNSQMTKYEIACLLSHLKAIYSLKNSTSSYFLICEDDITFDNIYLVNSDLKNIIQNAPEFDILMIHKIHCDEMKGLYMNRNEIKTKIFSTASYVISKSGISKLCSLFDIVDEKFIFKTRQKLNVADIFLYKNVNTIVYKYNFISTLETDSVIHKSHISYHNFSKNYQLQQISKNFI
jgi:GR25 family glycosyltransferase involved in LPS biosynthesis